MKFTTPICILLISCSPIFINEVYDKSNHKPILNSPQGQLISTGHFNLFLCLDESMLIQNDRYLVIPHGANKVWTFSKCDTGDELEHNLADLFYTYGLPFLVDRIVRNKYVWKDIPTLIDEANFCKSLSQ